MNGPAARDGGAPASRLARCLTALEERVPLRGLTRHVLDEPVPGGARWRYVFGSVLVALLGVQLASGLLLALDYAPTVDAAHASVSRIMSLPWGAFVRSAHHHGASFLVIVLVLHVVQVAWSGAYRKPRELNWLTGLGLGMIVLGFAFTGYLLPWDQNAFYATRVGLNIAHGTPIVGPALAQLAQGGDVLGNLTLTRFYAIHVIVLPGALLTLLGVHLSLFRRHGVTPPALLDENALRERQQRFWPEQAFRDACAATLAVGLLWIVAASLPAELGPPADPATPLDARPEWYFYWLFELLHWFEPPLEWLATMGIPGLLVGFLVLLPWIDRAPDRRPSSRKAPLAVLFLALAGISFLTVRVALREARAAEEDAAPETPAVAEADLEVVPVREAAVLYGLHCAECHGVAGAPQDEDATDFRTADFRRMAGNDFEALVGTIEFGGLDMPAFGDDLSTAQVRAILREVILPFSEVGDASP